jgi:hypothetical protein
MQPKRRSHLNVVVPCLVAIFVMLSLVAASPALYRLFERLNAPAAPAHAMSAGAADPHVVR